MRKTKRKKWKKPPKRVYHPPKTCRFDISDSPEQRLFQELKKSSTSNL